VSSTRERILEATGELFARQGYAGTGMNQIVSEGGAALGSIYHFFPGGKAELCAESIRRSGELYLTLIEAILGGADSIADGVHGFFLGAGEHLVLTSYADACPIATIALEVASTDEELRQATADVFGSWVAAVTRQLERGGVPAAEAGPLATFALAALEGAFILCRAHRSTGPIESAAAYVQRAVQDAVSRADRRESGQ
jgi:AcrR family transcriptional regulator